MGLSAEDKMEIIELVGRYNHAGDVGDADAWADTFTDDGVFESKQIRYEGRETLKQLAIDTVNGIEHPRHHTYNFVIEGDGDSANMKSSITVMSVAHDRGSARIVGVGNYDDTLIKVSGAWKFQRRFVRFLYWHNPTWPS